MKIAAIQYTAGADWRANIAQLEGLLDQVQLIAPDLLVLPENVFCHGGDYRALATQHGAELHDWLSAAARRLGVWRSEEHTSELQSRPHLVCRLLLEKKKKERVYTIQ